MFQGASHTNSQHVLHSPLPTHIFSSLQRSPQLRFNVEHLLSIRDIFKANIMTHLCFLFFRSQQNNRDLSLIQPPEAASLSVSSNGQGTSMCPPLILPQSSLVFSFLSMLSAVNILHQTQTITTFIFALSFTGVACAIYTSLASVLALFPVGELESLWIRVLLCIHGYTTGLWPCMHSAIGLAVHLSVPPALGVAS